MESLFTSNLTPDHNDQNHFKTPITKKSLIGSNRQKINKSNPVGKLLITNKSIQSRKQSLEKGGKFYFSGDNKYYHTNFDNNFSIP